MVSLGLLMSYPLQFFVAISIMWPAIEERRGPLKYPMTSQRLFRVLLVLFTCKLRMMFTTKFTHLTDQTIFFVYFHSCAGWKCARIELFHFAYWCFMLVWLGVGFPTIDWISSRLWLIRSPKLFLTQQKCIHFMLGFIRLGYRNVWKLECDNFRVPGQKSHSRWTLACKMPSFNEDARSTTKIKYVMINVPYLLWLDWKL